jgi:DNA-binding NarL/FixJ family response regulator
VKDIAARLLLSVKTLDARKTNPMRKLDLHDRAGNIKCRFRGGSFSFRP